jgi:glycine cleavage system aminomethyltransferase T
MIGTKRSITSKNSTGLSLSLPISSKGYIENERRKNMKVKAPSTLFEGAFTLYVTGPDSFLPYEYTGQEDELLACRHSAWLGSNLCLSPVYDVYGPDAVKFLNWACVNRDFSTVPAHSCRHAITCNDKGQMLADGVLIKIGENHFRTYWLAPVLEYRLQTSGMEVQGRYVSDEEYFFQIDGPKSLEILEKACQCDLHDLKFARHRMVKMRGMDMRVLRLGMSGALAYEVHGPAQDADKVFELIKEAGRELGLRPLGVRHYSALNHTPGGYPNQFIHYYYPYWTSGEGLAEFYENKKMRPRPVWVGSCADDPESYLVTPYDAGWASRVNFEHEFIGKEALVKIAEDPPRRPVTLEWDADDVAEIYASQFRGPGAEPYERIDPPRDLRETYPWLQFRMDKVMVDGKWVGVASGRCTDYYHHRMLSLSFIDKKYAAPGTDGVVLWGTPGRPQKEVRAKVAAFPYYNGEYRNETFATEKIPHPSLTSKALGGTS